jgi:hypothetical protein
MTIPRPRRLLSGMFTAALVLMILAVRAAGDALRELL